MSNDNNKDWGWKAALSALMLLLTTLALIMLYAHGCSVGPKKTVVESPNNPPPVTCADGSAVGTTRTVACPPEKTVGSDLQVCTLNPTTNVASWVDGSNTCALPPPPACGKVQFSDILPTLQNNCKSCHTAIVSYATAQAWSAGISRRVGLPQGNNDHMPQGTSPQLTQDQIAQLQKWVADGAVNTCQTAQVPATITEDYIATAMVNDATTLSAGDRPSTRYLITAGAVNSGITGDQLQVWVDAMNKAVNSLNDQGQQLVAVQSIEPSKSVWRIDLRNYSIGQAEIAAIEAGDVNINIVDNTSKGLVLQSLLGTKKPWFHADNFIDVAFRNSDVYYRVLNIPKTLKALQANLGVNFAADLANLQSVNFIGSTQSPIAEQKNRLIVRDVQQRSISSAYYWQTFDVNAIPSNGFVGTITAGSNIVDDLNKLTGISKGDLVAGNGITAGTTVVGVAVVNGKNKITISLPAVLSIKGDNLAIGKNTKDLFQFPLLAGTGGGNGTTASVENYTADASEVFWQLPNGMQGYALFDAAGNLLNNADPNVVIDTATPLGNKVINAANSCGRCHNQGTIPFVDQINAHVSENAAQFLANDVQLVKAVYRGAGANAALFRIDNAKFSAALAQLGVKEGPDAMSVVTDRFLQNWDINQAAGFLLLSQDDFVQALNESPIAKAELGTLLTPGGTVTFAQFTGVEQQLIQDAHLFQDPVVQ